MKKILFFALGALFLQGCLSHWVVDGELRLQLENRSAFPVAALAVVALDGERSVWIPDTLSPGKKSLVHAGSWVGNFRLQMAARDSVNASGDTCWRWVDLGAQDLEGGSALARVRREDGQWSLELK